MRMSMGMRMKMQPMPMPMHMIKWQPNTLRQLPNERLHLLIVPILQLMLELHLPIVRLCVFFIFFFGISRSAFLDLVADFVECCGPRWAVDIVVLVEPVAEDAACGLYAADLDAFAAPAFFSEGMLASFVPLLKRETRDKKEGRNLELELMTYPL